MSIYKDNNSDYYHEYNLKTLNRVKNVPTQDLNTLMDGNELSFRQQCYWQTILKNYVTQGVMRPYQHHKIWEEAIKDPMKWRPDLTHFMPRVRIAAKAYGNNELPKDAEDIPRGTPENTCPTRICMFKSCHNDRERPFVNDIIWWEGGKNGNFEEQWKNFYGLLKPFYYHFDLKNRICWYGLFLCQFHYHTIYNTCFPNSQHYPHDKYFPSPELKPIKEIRKLLNNGYFFKKMVDIGN